MSDKLKAIKAPADFNELISLQQLSTQMSALEFLQKNLKEYQKSYFMSYAKTFEEVMAIIPEKDRKTYFSKHLHWLEADSTKKLDHHFNDFGMTNMLRQNRRFFLNHEKKQMADIWVEDLDNFNFVRHANPDLFVAKLNRHWSDQYAKSTYHQVSPYEFMDVVYFEFCMKTNALKNIEAYGSWAIHNHMHNNRQFRR